MNTMTYSADATAILNELVQRRITHLCHFTTFGNVRSIFKMGALYSRQTLEDLRVPADFQDPLRCDGARYINLSIHEVNFRLLSKFAYDQPYAEWCILRLRKEICMRTGVRFTTDNAAAGQVRQYGTAEGVFGLKALFAASVPAKDGCVTRKANKPMNLPTSPQAEVLCPEPIALRDVMDVMVVNWGAKQRLVNKYGIPDALVKVGWECFPSMLRNRSYEGAVMD